MSARWRSLGAVVRVAAAALVLGLVSEARADTFDLEVHAYCVIPALEPDGSVCGELNPGGEAKLHATIVKAVHDMNLRWCANGITFRHASTDLTYDINYSLTTFANGALVADDPDYLDTFGAFNIYELRQMAAQDPTKLHVFVLHKLESGFSAIPESPQPANFYPNVYQGMFVAPWLPGGGWAHEGGHHFGLSHTFTWQDIAELGGAPIDRDLDNLACTTDDPGILEDHPGTEDDDAPSGVLLVDHEYCDFQETTTPPVDQGSPKSNYCTGGCYWNPGTGEVDMGIAPQTWNAMTYNHAVCQGPYVLNGSYRPAFCSDQTNVIWNTLNTIPERIALNEVCGSAGGDADCDGLCQNVDQCPGVSSPAVVSQGAPPICAPPAGQFWQQDSDCDGEPNACDLCPYVQGPVNDADGDGLGDPCDNDIDGDTCPQICLDPDCPGQDLDPYDDKMVAGTILHPLCPSDETVYAYGWEDADGDGVINCADPDDDNDELCDGDTAWDKDTPGAVAGCAAGPDPCPINDDQICRWPGLPCGENPIWQEVCRFGGCNEFLLKLVERINPDPTLPAYFDRFEALGGTIYASPLEGLALSQTGALFAPDADGVRALVLEDPASGRDVATVAEWDATGLALGDLAKGEVLALTPSAATAGAAAPAAASTPTGLTVGASWAVGALPGTPLADADRDGVPDFADSCLLTPNPGQIDTDEDDYGDRCDPDFDQDGVVGESDRGMLEDCAGVDFDDLQPFFESEAIPAGFAPEKEMRRQRCTGRDLNGDRVIDTLDDDILAAALGGAPGPTGRRAAVVDFDRDGVLDPDDNCPYTPNPRQLDSGGIDTTDPDGDGDECECGDVTNNGIVQINDATIVKRAILGLGPGLAAPLKCNVIGTTDLADADRNGLPDDCAINDATVIKRAILGLGPGVRQVCAPAIGPGP